MTTTVEHESTAFDFGDGWGAVPAVRRPNGAWCAKSAKIGSYTEIGSGAKIGSYTEIGSGADIGSYAKIGSGADIGSYAEIGSCAEIGSGAEILRLGPVGSRSAMLHVYPLKDGTVACSTGCFCQHTLAELIAACIETHGEDSPHTRDYRDLATAGFAIMARRIASRTPTEGRDK